MPLQDCITNVRYRVRPRLQSNMQKGHRRANRGRQTASRGANRYELWVQTLGNFGTVRCGQRLESTLVTRRLFSATCGSSKRHTAPCAISSALGRPSLLVQSATFWAMCGRSKWHTTPCAIWSAFGRLLFQVRYVLFACQHPESAAFSPKRR